MKISLPSLLAIVLLAAPIMSAARAYGQTPETGQLEAANDAESNTQDDQGTPRVARLSIVQGDVSFERAGDKDWVQAVNNLPLLTGDQIYTGERSSATIQMAHGTFIRLSERTALAITELSEQGAQIEITSGTAVVQVYRLREVFDRFEIDTPVVASVLQSDGTYRVQVQDNGETELATRDGLAEVSTDDGTLRVRAGYRLQAGVKGSGKLDVVAIASLDDWDVAGQPSDATIDGGGASDSSSGAAPDYVGSYQDTYGSLYGLDELSGYGSWTSLPTYGNCWVPRVGYGWAPYRSGRWLWIPTLGWTWLPYEPWGWAPYHYGRWELIPGLGWAWVPGFGPQPFPYGYGYSYYAWRPALVYFFNYSTPGGRYVGWRPLRPGDVWHRPGWYEHHHNPSGWGRPVLHATGAGVSVLPAGTFAGTGAGRPEAPGREHTRILQGIERPGPGAGPVQAGLSGVQPGRLAGVPVRAVDGGKTFVTQPPPGIIGRSVVTRHLPVASSGEANQIPRERRLVEPVPPRKGLTRDASSVGDEAPDAGGRGNDARGVKSHTPAFAGSGDKSGDSGSYTRSNREEDHRIRRGEASSSGVEDTARHKDRTGTQEQYVNEAPRERRYESPRYQAPTDHPDRSAERDSAKPAGKSGGQDNSGGGHAQQHHDSQPHNGGGQSSGSSSNSSGHSSGSSGNSGTQNSSSSTQGHSSKKN